MDEGQKQGISKQYSGMQPMLCERQTRRGGAEQKDELAGAKAPMKGTVKGEIRHHEQHPEAKKRKTNRKKPRRKAA